MLGLKISNLINTVCSLFSCLLVSSMLCCGKNVLQRSRRGKYCSNLLRDAIISMWTKISEECFQHLVESMPRRIKTVVKAKGLQPGTSKVYLIKWPVSVYW